MGQLTRSQIVTQGLLLAGDDSLTLIANVWLNSFLKRAYDAWPWPFLQQRITGVLLVGGTTSLAFGKGSGGVSAAVRRVIDPLWLYSSDYTVKGKPRIRQLTDGMAQDDETINNPATNRGAPKLFKVRADPTVWGKWALIPTPVPDRAYLLGIDYIFTPDPLDTTSTGDSSVPVYPNDETMIQAVFAAALKHQNKYDVAASEGQILAAKVVNDRVVYGSVDGTNDSLGLDTSIFR